MLKKLMLIATITMVTTTVVNAKSLFHSKQLPAALKQMPSETDPVEHADFSGTWKGNCDDDAPGDVYTLKIVDTGNNLEIIFESGEIERIYFSVLKTTVNTDPSGLSQALDSKVVYWSDNNQVLNLKRLFTRVTRDNQEMQQYVTNHSKYYIEDGLMKEKWSSRVVNLNNPTDNHGDESICVYHKIA